MKYRVFENNQPAMIYPEQPELGWSKYEFDTFQEAHDYAVSWLGIYAGGIELQLNVPVCFYGDECFIEIRGEE